MKKLSVVKFVFSVLIILTIMIISCKDDDKGDEGNYICQSSSILNATYQACCNPSQCYYEYDGKKYWCDGVDCAGAAQDLTNDIISINTLNLNADEVIILQNKILGVDMK